jgi:AAHS family benzoate transporter-like MFS transporter
MRIIDIHEIAEHARLNRFHFAVLACCASIMLVDGYDLVITGIALPAILRDFGLSPAAAGILVSTTFLGTLCGGVVFGNLADRKGRRVVIAICITIFSAFTALAGAADGPWVFGIARFIAGLGLGGVMPALLAQLAEYTPRRVRSTFVTIAFTGYSLGGIIAAVLGKLMLPSMGWSSIFYVAGASLVLVPIALKLLPESVAHLSRLRDRAALARVVLRIDPSHRLADDDTFLEPSLPKSATDVFKNLFTEGRALGTGMLWTAFFMSLFMVYALSSWLAELMYRAGHDIGSSLTFVLALNIGGMIGAVGGGMLGDRHNIRRVLAGMFFIGGVAISLLGVAPTGVQLLLLVLIGATSIGTTNVVYALAAQYYPSALRGTGIGVASGVGRLGAFAAPVVIGALVGLAFPIQYTFLFMALPALVGMLVVNWIRVRSSRDRAPAVTPGDQSYSTDVMDRAD